MWGPVNALSRAAVDSSDQPPTPSCSHRLPSHQRLAEMCAQPAPCDCLPQPASCRASRLQGFVQFRLSGERIHLDVDSLNEQLKVQGPDRLRCGGSLQHATCASCRKGWHAVSWVQAVLQEWAGTTMQAQDAATVAGATGAHCPQARVGGAEPTAGCRPHVVCRHSMRPDEAFGLIFQFDNVVSRQ